MFFYGWGKKSKQWSMGDGKELILNYSYFSLMFIFQVAFKKEWFMVGRDRAEDVELTREQVEQRYGADTPQLGLWSSWGLLLTFGLMVGFVVILAALP